MKLLLYALIGVATAIVLSTRRIGLGNWEFWAITFLICCGEFLGAMA